MLVRLTERGSFSGHETFPLRYTWLRKAVDHVAADPDAFARDDAMVALGVGKNMVKSIRHWSLLAGVVEEDPKPGRRLPPLRVSDLGERLIAGWDPDFEDPGTYWLIHWQIAQKPEKATTWYWVFSHLPQPEFTKSDLERWLWALIEEHGWKRISPSSLRRDIDCFIRTYVPAKPTRKTPLEDTLDCPLVELGLIREFGRKGHYLLERGDQDSLPDAVVAHALVEFIEGRQDRSGTVALDSVAFAPGSPGRVFCLSEDALLRRLERLGHVTDGAIEFDETAGLRQLLVRRSLQPYEILDRYYEAQAEVAAQAVGGAA